MFRTLHSYARACAGYLLVALALVACGGGGGDSDDGASGFLPAPEPTGANVDITLVGINGESSTEITPLEAGRFQVTVTTPDGQALAQETVSGEVSLGRLRPEGGTALTDSEGVATFIVQPGGIAGAGTLTAAVSYNGVESSGSLNYSITTDLPFTLSGTFKGTDGTPATSAVTGNQIILIASLYDDRDGTPVRNQRISADIGDLGSITPASGTAVTDDAGEAVFTIDVGTTPGVFPIVLSAVVPGGSVNQSVDISIDQALHRLGHIDVNGTFVEGVIGIIPEGPLSPDGTAILSLAVVDEDNNLVSQSDKITVSSSCLFNDRAALDPASPITVNSRVSLDYTLRGCTGEDVITAVLAGSGEEASGVIDIMELEPTRAARIIFSRADPELIALRGTGSASDLSEFANVSFDVSDLNGDPVANARVNFELIQTVGGLALACVDSSFCAYATDKEAAQGRSSRDTSQSSAEGKATTRVLAGSVATPVQVLAYVDLNANDQRDLNEPTTTSKTLVVSTGLPDQNSVSLSASVLNIEGAYDTDGKTSEITVRLADKFNNPAPDGSAAIFSTELGSIIGSCNTVGGVCSVIWTSQSPRGSDTVEQFSSPITIHENLDRSTPNRYQCPSHRENHGPCPDDIGDPTVNPPGAPRGGRSAILVTTTGEESFVDRNANGVYDEGEYWTNLTEAFIDHNEDAVYTPVQRDNCENPGSADDVCLAGFEETFIDRNVNGIFDLNETPKTANGSSLPSGLFNGVLCPEADSAAGVCSRELVNVRDSLVVVTAFSDASSYDIMVINTSGREPSTLQGDQFYTVYVSDKFNNPPPPDSRLTFEGSGECEALTELSPIPDINAAGAYSAALAVQTNNYAQSIEDAAALPPDQLTVKLMLPNGSFIEETYSCRVDRCADNPEQVPDFSPAPPACGEEQG